MCVCVLMDLSEAQRLDDEWTPAKQHPKHICFFVGASDGWLSYLDEPTNGGEKLEELFHSKQHHNIIVFSSPFLCPWTLGQKHKNKNDHSININIMYCKICFKNVTFFIIIKAAALQWK